MWKTDNINADVDYQDQRARKLPEKHPFVFSISQEVNSYLNPFSCPPTWSIAALHLLLHFQLLNGAEKLWLPWRGPHPSGKPLLKSNPLKVPSALSEMGSCSSAEYPLIACHSQTSWFFLPDGDIKYISSDVITISQLMKLVGRHSQGLEGALSCFLWSFFLSGQLQMCQCKGCCSWEARLSRWRLCILQASRNNPCIDWNVLLKGDQK